MEKQDATMVPSETQPDDENKIVRHSEFDGRSLREELIPYLPYVDKLQVNSIPTPTGFIPAHEKPNPWINFKMLKGWLRTCQQNHEDHCEAQSHHARSPWHGPLWLIDTLYRRLVPYDGEVKYFALSYVWGMSTDGPEAEINLRQDSLSKLQQNQFFMNKQGKPKHIPQLINDVVELVRRIDSWQYLWIDRYCIMQDDGPAKNAQISAMNAIYAGAFATIIAADATAESGIRGIKGHSKGRVALDVEDAKSKSAVTSFRDREVIEADDLNIDAFRGLILEKHRQEGRTPFTRSRGSSIDSWDSFYDFDEHRARHDVKRQEARAKDRSILENQAYLLLHSPWYSRGWTFQESLFSRRKIIFQNERVNWECHCSAHYDGQESKRGDEPCSKRVDGNTDGGFEMTSWPDLYRYARLVCLFNRRNLTFPEDALFAFAGVMSSLSLTFKYGFISGLPQMFFHSTLIWQPYQPMSRREARVDGDPTLPSWSWAGWHGVIQSESWRSGYAYVKQLAGTSDLERTSWRTFETVKWFRLDNAGGKHTIKSRDVHFNNDDYTPENGWAADSETSSDESMATWHHKSIPDTHFWRPVELRDPIKARVPPVYCRYITASTRKVLVKAGPSFMDTHVSRCTAVDLINGHGDWIGVLRLPSSQPPSAEIYELIELSRGSVQKQDGEKDAFEEWDRPGMERYWAGGVYEFYNVMAIRSRDGIAYREAVGRIEKTSWEALETLEVEVVLG